MPSANFDGEQGDQIGQIFAYWAIVYLQRAANLKMTETAQIWSTFSTM
jgi:hypothetical protein